MFGDDHLGISAGKTALTWILGQTNVWYMLYHFAHKASKDTSFTQIQSDVSILDDLFNLGGGSESEQTANDLEELRNYFLNTSRAETLTNGSLSLSPPPASNQQAGHSNPSHLVAQKDSGGLLQVMQPASNPGSPPPTPPLASPISQGSTLDPNWQATKPSVRERNAAMFNNDLMADIRFVVGPMGSTQIIPAHKYVLATGSSVFFAMFYGGLAECKEEIEVPDVEPSAFLTLLKYLYCDEIHLEADTVLATLYVAKKYIVPHLARACVNYLETSLTAKNACLLLSQSRLFEEPELMQRCWEVIDAQVRHSLSYLDLTRDVDVDCAQDQRAKKRHFSFSACLQSNIA